MFCFVGTILSVDRVFHTSTFVPGFTGMRTIGAARGGDDGFLCGFEV
jgi:hypothetical protein